MYGAPGKDRTPMRKTNTSIKKQGKNGARKIPIGEN